MTKLLINCSNFRLLAIVLLGLILINSPVFSEGDRFSFTADSVETILVEGSERTILTGNVALMSPDSEMFADRIELYGKEINIIVAEGHVQVIRDEGRMEFNSQNLFYDRKRGLVQIRGPAVIFYRDYDIIINGNYVEHWYDKNETIVRSEARLIGVDLEAHAEFMHYFRDEQIFKLSGLPMLTWKENEYRAINICLELNTDRIMLTGTVSGEVLTKERL